MNQTTIVMLLAAQNKRMEEETRRAEALARDLDAYAQSVAHDLRSPIQKIAGYADLLARECGTELGHEAREIVERIAKGCARMDQITSELLEVARARRARRDAGKRLDMTRIVGHARERVSRLIEETGAEVLVPDEWPAALGRAAWVEEVWANYLSNAIRFGGAPPRIELGAASVSESEVGFWIRDNGAGFEAGDSQRLFEEFSPARSVRPDGHGLGLSIVKRIVGHLGGTVHATSRRGVGSTFGFTLPAAPAPA